MDIDEALAETKLDPLGHTLSEARSTAAGTEGARPAAPLTASSRYQRVAEIGRGGMGVVYRATDLQFSRDVAVKQLLPELADDADLNERFATECLVTGNLEHPGVPPVYEHGASDGAPFYAMRRVRGRTMKAVLRERDSLDERLPLIADLIRVAQTLAYAHSRGVIHRDVKPSNIVLGDYGETFVLDWGVAKVQGLTQAGDGQPAAGSTEVDGSVVGTPSYMSPEQAAGRSEATDERSDVFALGALLYHILCGRAPIVADNVDEAIEAARRADFESIHAAAPRAPRLLRSICERAMAREPGDRYRSAGEMVAALESFTADAVAHSDAGPVGWIARVVTAISGLLVLGSIAAVISLLPRLHQLGQGAYPTLVIAAIGFALSILEWSTSGRYRLGPLIVAMAVVTFISGVVSTAQGIDTTLVTADEVSDGARAARLVMAGVGESIGNVTLAGVLTIGQVFAWALARRKALRA